MRPEQEHRTEQLRRSLELLGCKCRLRGLFECRCAAIRERLLNWMAIKERRDFFKRDRKVEILTAFDRADNYAGDFAVFVQDGPSARSVRHRRRDLQITVPVI